ncbi:MAG: peptidoglycan-binding protein [Patescibacteria group bacterium]|nr:peptidoglycan-binding protein [Patescibacteria group bacterium]
MRIKIFTILSLLILAVMATLGEEVKTTTTTTVPTLSEATVTPLEVPQVILKPGMRHGENKKLQRILKELGFMPDNLATTEFYGFHTKRGIIKFQKSQGLPPTGVFDERTRQALSDYINKRSEYLRNKKMKSPDEVLSKLTENLDQNVSSTCMKLAVEKRENALINGWENYHSKMKIAYENRKNDLISAWAIQDPKQRQEMIKTAWQKFRQARVIALTEWNLTRKNIWLDFSREAVRCQATVVEQETLEKVEMSE